MTLNGGWTYREQVGPEGGGLTVLEYLAATRYHSTSEEWAERLERGEVEIDGCRVSCSAVLHPGQTIAWHRPPWHEDDVPRNYSIVYEDDSIVAVDKPSGLPTMPAGGFLNHTLLALLRDTYPEASPLHRLGRHTSGLVLFARTHDAASKLSQAWRDHAVKKMYRALGLGETRTEIFVIDVPIGPVPHPLLGTVEAASEGGKPSHSVAVVLETSGDRTLFDVEIVTGRPHQVRIHLAYAGHPLVGDPLYEAGGGLKRHPGLPGDGGYLLHAEQLHFAHPVTGKPMSLIAPPPPALQTRAEQLTDAALAR
ncbi:MAG TPA: RluA family pseudouridine synthase [Vicinamibacterales bacterium]|nr:RluA family pseudouridine synthase [Vicinamibacterales bacterium]